MLLKGDAKLYYTHYSCVVWFACDLLTKMQIV